LRARSDAKHSSERLFRVFRVYYHNIVTEYDALRSEFGDRRCSESCFCGRSQRKPSRRDCSAVSERAWHSTRNRSFMSAFPSDRSFSNIGPAQGVGPIRPRRPRQRPCEISEASRMQKSGSGHPLGAQARPPFAAKRQGFCRPQLHLNTLAASRSRNRAK
jgi:hypothetical protein